MRAARLFRGALTDPFFPRRLSGLAFNQEELLRAMDVFGDVIRGTDDILRAKAELQTLAEIENSDHTNKEKCQAVWQLIKGGE